MANKNNPIKNDPVLKELMGQAKDFKTEEDFKGWRQSFLDAYSGYLDDTGRENAHASEEHLLKSLKKLSKTVIKVYAFTQDGSITKEKAGVRGQRALTDMTDQMAASEKILHDFMPTTQDVEEKMGYNKFELGAVLIADGFEVYEILRSIKDIINTMRDVTLNHVCSSNSIRVIDFFIRQADTFSNVMADLGLLTLMEQVVEMYQANPRSKRSATVPIPVEKPKSPPKPKDDAAPAAATPTPKSESAAKPKPKPKNKSAKPKNKSKSTESNDSNDSFFDRDPNEPASKKKNVKTRAIIDNGYVNPLMAGSGSGKGKGKTKDVPSKPKAKTKNPQDDNNNNSGNGEGGDSTDEVIYFDMRTGRIGKILRSKLAEKDIIVTKDDGDKEKLEGEIEDHQERENLIWKMKKAMKKKTAAKK